MILQRRKREHADLLRTSLIHPETTLKNRVS